MTQTLGLKTVLYNRKVKIYAQTPDIQRKQFQPRKPMLPFVLFCFFVLGFPFFYAVLFHIFLTMFQLVPYILLRSQQGGRSWVTQRLKCRPGPPFQISETCISSLYLAMVFGYGLSLVKSKISKRFMKN